jgi:hypothetical protein
MVSLPIKLHYNEEVIETVVSTNIEIFIEYINIAVEKYISPYVRIQNSNIRITLLCFGIHRLGTNKNIHT